MSYESTKKSEFHRLLETYLKKYDLSMEDLDKLKGTTMRIHVDRSLAKPTWFPTSYIEKQRRALEMTRQASTVMMAGGAQQISRDEFVVPIHVHDSIYMMDFDPVEKAIYTTNAIESVNGVIRKFTRNRKQYPNSDSAVKLIWLAISEASKKWTMPIVGWKQALNHFAILFEGRMPAKLND